MRIKAPQLELSACANAFNLAGERGVDGARLIAELAEAMRREREAKAWQDKMQRKLSECPGFVGCRPPGEQSPAMKSALGFMARGELVPDETVVALVCERVPCLRCISGFLLDGFPRTVVQAEALERLLKVEDLPLTGVINYELPIEKIVERLAGRRVCSSCKGISHVADKLPSPGTCPQCGGKLIQREDDRPEAIRVRMEAYRRSTEPLIEYYGQRNLLLTISAEGTPPEILQRTVDALALRPRKKLRSQK